MVKVNLFFDVFQDKELEKKSGKYEIIRLKCRVRFKISNGWSEPYSAILDTGAHTPLVPLSIWEEIKTTRIADHFVQGISAKPECSIPVVIGKTACIIVDELRESDRRI